MITVARFLDPLQAHIVRGRLEAEGILAFVAFEHHVWLNWLISNAIGNVRLQVPPSLAEDALSILQRIRENDFSVLLDEIYGSDALMCPNCRSRRTTRYKFSERIGLLILGLLHFPLPFETGRYLCNNCGFSWLSQDAKAYSRAFLFWVIVVEVSLIGGVMGILNFICASGAGGDACFPSSVTVRIIY